MNGAQALFKALTDAGLDTCFANPGTSEMQLVYEIGQTKGVRPILCLEENVVTGAADGYGRMAGRPAFTLLHVGSGFANGIANIHNAGRANTTMVNVVGANATYHQPNFAEHEFIGGKIVDLARVVSHWAHEAKSASDLGVLGAMAARYSRMGAGKICTVVAPTNCHWDPAVAPPVPAAPLETPKVSPQTIQEVVALLTNGKKTAIALGSHAMYGDGLELAGRIAAKSGADLLVETTPSRLARGEGRVAVEKIPYLPEDAIPFFQKYEQLILVGALFPVTTFAYKGKPVIKVPASCEVTAFATVDHDILSALADLAKAVGTPSQPATRRVRSERAPPSGALTDATIGQTMGLLLPQNAILVSDSATTEAALYLGTEGALAHDYLFADCGGAIGAGLPVALGAAVACPDRKTIVLEGDGSGMYTPQSLWTMARENVDVTVVVLKNDNYGILNIELARVRDGDPNEKMLSMLHLSNPSLDWVKLAEAQGVPATRATTAEEFHRQFAAAMSTKGPKLIEAKIVQNLQPAIDAVHKARVP
ncbi:acetolactate synthase large subunit [Bradyrhizobium sp. 41S5]|uniref:acetolactate synthase large subunit n=1 Tax=Bradyrhizobium sp. 41S5 TaxID=1404443 RepID=UPI00156B3ED5|nr:acetolactate synthase large subunit [Bradyrhizobium sp. 41S5]UFX44464.1 acetolactate synthase large subunit [Bradyrhizobium sp. 41S5]